MTEQRESRGDALERKILNDTVAFIRTIAERRGWVVRRRMSLLVVADTSANREIVRRHPTLFAEFARRRLSHAAFAADHQRLLTWVSHGSAARPPWVAGRERVRIQRSA